jgi:predicted GIY-YIG superfamily endonuclease
MEYRKRIVDMKIAGRERRNKPYCLILWPMQEYSTRGWVYREGQGWVFAELTPDELAEFKAYKCGSITIPRMRVRLPYSQPIDFYQPELNELENFAHWFAGCTMPKAHPLVLSRFRLHQRTGDEPTRYPVKRGGYETWLWSDEVNFCRGVGCNVTLHYAYVWREWGVPPEWKPPLQYKERIFIYAFVNELTQEVYVGQTNNLERRQAAHLRDTGNSDKVALIQSLRSQRCEPKLIKLEEVAGEKAIEKERYWTSYYKSQGYKITNHDYRSLSRVEKK